MNEVTEIEIYVDNIDLETEAAEDAAYIAEIFG